MRLYCSEDAIKNDIKQNDCECFLCRINVYLMSNTVISVGCMQVLQREIKENGKIHVVKWRH